MGTWKETPLHFAVRNGRVDAAKELLKAGASTTAATYGGDTALELARKYRMSAVAQLFPSPPTSDVGQATLGQSARGRTGQHVNMRPERCFGPTLLACPRWRLLLLLASALGLVFTAPEKGGTKFF